MKISKLALIALLGGALMAFGCSDDSNGGGSGGSGGTAGSGGAGGAGGAGGVGGAPVACVELPASCNNGEIEPTDTSTCMLPAAPDADVCEGTESTTNPASCTFTESTITVFLSQLEIDGDCNSGYDLDSCAGNSCNLGGLAPGEGEGGNDNALAGLAPVLVNVGGNLGGVNQAFYDGLCTGDIVIGFTIDANAEENCATVQVLDEDGPTGDPILMNLGSTGCLSGTLGELPLNVAGIPGTMGNAVIRATLSEAGLSNGSLGGTVDEATASSIADQLIDGGSAVVAQVLDINDDLSGDVGTDCNALSTTLVVGGPAEEVQN